MEWSLWAALFGTLLCIFVPAFARHVRVSKTAEAAERLMGLSRALGAHYAVKHVGEEKNLGRCMVESAGPAPRRVSQEARSYDFHLPTAPGATTWQALDFNPEQTRFRYVVRTSRSGCVEPNVQGDEVAAKDRVWVEAQSDLDGDGKYGIYTREMRSDGQHLVPVAGLQVLDRGE